MKKTAMYRALPPMLILLVGSLNASFATKHTVLVSGTALSPDTLTNVYIGDTIRWEYVNDGDSHSMMFNSTPTGAGSINFQLNSTNTFYEYKVVYAGQYEYTCYPHGFFAGYFNAQDPLSVSELPSSYNVYPNPASGEILLDIPSETGLVKASLFTAEGRKIKEETIGLAAKMNIAGLSKGIYFIELAAGGKNLGRKRIVIQ